MAVCFYAGMLSSREREESPPDMLLILINYLYESKANMADSFYGKSSFQPEGVCVCSAPEPKFLFHQSQLVLPDKAVIVTD